jgi:hypothetical protein
LEAKQWDSNIPISTYYKRHLKWWDGDYHKYGTKIQIHHRHEYVDNNIKFKTSLLYSKGVEEHHDQELDTPYSALLILYNKGFLVWQEGLGDIPQQPGTIVLLNIHELHELTRIDRRCTKWAAISIDYYESLSPQIIETQLQGTYDRIFN